MVPSQSPSLYLHRICLCACVLLVSQGLFASGHVEIKRPTIDPETRDALIARYDAFVAAMDQKYFGRAAELNGNADVEDRVMETEYSDYELRVTRGEVVEKLGRMLSDGKKTQPGRNSGAVLTWGRFYSLDFHPKTPLVGMLHATIVLQFFEDGTAGVGGWLGVLPGTRVDEDLNMLKTLTDEHFAAHDKEPALYRRLICKGTEDTNAEWRRKPACVGASFYGPPVYRDDVEKSYIFIEEMYDKFTDAYVDTIVKRANDPVTEADIAAQEEMRLRWLEDQLFSDPFASGLVPWKAWTFANMPPVVKF